MPLFFLGFIRLKTLLNNQLLQQAIQQKYKKPALGGILGVVPGLGYLYAGHKQTFVSAFLLNGLLMYATYSSFEAGNDDCREYIGAMELCGF